MIIHTCFKCYILYYYICNNDNNYLYNNINTPTYIVFEEDGRIGVVFFDRINKYHRTDGPAYVEYCRNGEIIKEYYIDDKKLSKVDFFLYKMKNLMP